MSSTLNMARVSRKPPFRITYAYLLAAGRGADAAGCTLEVIAYWRTEEPETPSR